MYIVSSCLLGNNCKYNGGNNYNEDVIAFCEKHSYCLVCPETEGGLSAPRPPAEILGDRIVDCDGNDRTEAFLLGAKRCWEIAQAEASRRGEKIEGAILKAKSPSCGNQFIYDGTFSGKLIAGEGVFTKILKEYQISVISEKEIIQW